MHDLGIQKTRSELLFPKDIYFIDELCGMDLRVGTKLFPLYFFLQ